jgi:glucokinase
MDKSLLANFVQGLSQDEIWDRLTSSIVQSSASFAKYLRSDSPIAVSFPGPISSAGLVLSAPTLIGPSVITRDFRSDVEAATNRRTYILNDITAAAWKYSTVVQAERFLIITISSGIGSKIFDHRHARHVLDDTPYGGEIGHCIVDFSPDPIPCDCGGKGHLGGIASGRGIERFARVRAAAEPEAFGASACVRVFGATTASLANELHLVPAVLQGDSWATEIVLECTRYLARVIVPVVLAVGIQQVIIVGGFAQALGATYKRLLCQALREVSDYSLLKEHVEGLVLLGSPGEEACLLGASLFASCCAEFEDEHRDRRR